MQHGWWQRIGTSVTAAAVLLSSLAPSPAQAVPPEGVTISGVGDCLVRDGGHEGFRINYEFRWYLSDSSPVGSSMTVGGNYSIEVHNVVTDQWSTLRTWPYGFNIISNGQEVRGERVSPRDPHFAFDRMRLVTTWAIEENGASGTETNEIGCTLQPAKEGKELLAETPPPAEDDIASTGDEVFIHTFDPSPNSNLVFDTWLLCYHKSSGRRQDIHWGLSPNNNGIGGDGVLVSGIVRLSGRGPGGAYSQMHEEPFGIFLMNREQQIVDGYLESSGLVATKLEVEWRLSYGPKEDPGARVLKVVRTYGCSTE